MPQTRGKGSLSIVWGILSLANDGFWRLVDQPVYPADPTRDLPQPHLTPHIPGASKFFRCGIIAPATPPLACESCRP